MDKAQYRAKCTVGDEIRIFRISLLMLCSPGIGNLLAVAIKNISLKFPTGCIGSWSTLLLTASNTAVSW